MALATSSASASSASRAQFGSDETESYNVAIVINADDSVNVTETITQVFNTSGRHGIERFIPVVFPYDVAGAKKPDSRADYERLTPISDVSASSPDAPSDLEKIDGKNDNPDYAHYRIGDANQTVSGRHTYTFSYRLGSVMNAFEDHDELYFNPIGNQWQQSIASASATVTAPGVPTKVACFAGPDGSVLPCDGATIADGKAMFSASNLGSGDGMTVVVALRKGVVNTPTPDLREKWTIASAFRPTGPAMAGGGGLLALGLAGVGWLLYRNGRDRRFLGNATDAAFGNTTGDDGPVPLFDKDAHPVEFVPPDNIRPGHMGTLWDEQANPLDVSAMIVDLAVRGYLRIDEVEPPHKSLMGGSVGGDYHFAQLKNSDDQLLHAESVLLDSIFRDGTTVELSALKQNFLPRLQLVESALYDDSVTAGWFPTRPDRVRARWHGIAIAATVLGGAICGLIAWRTHWGLVALPLPIVGLILLGVSHRFPHRSAKGTAMLGRVKGFKQLFDVGEGDRQRFIEQKHLFSEYLPYAIVFGCAEQWASTFASLGATPQEMGLGGWYTSPYGIDPFMFGWVLSSFATATTGSIAMAAPSSSASGGGSGFGGGGFSGGGFGGGGGGSW